ncbi:hypothetical protein SAY86_027536 [Trapa natans]|uniref:RRM domain-containing protein n=1 Tax=Trapa natans TaxID=22666 RepID=A0AAN7KU21_TRANT|nr:hypothetical protein SAY86_027536 [Trapa natans]
MTAGAGQTSAPVAMLDPVRIFVGGLGEKVTEEELKSIFESRNLGRVEGIDIVRTKGRSFAYCDFLPSSAASLSKLFSMYNGCAWKGGRLRLEKAKEHYVLRMRREWEEDAALIGPQDDAVSAEKVMELPKMPRTSINLEGRINIFFPRLRKVKSLPLKGTGKHKYSFQRLEVLPYPKHFCDCEEHSGSLLILKEKQISKPELMDGGVDAKEFDLMKSVMNKLFEKEMGSEIRQDEEKFAQKKVDEDKNYDKDEDNMEEDMLEDDGLVINMVTSSGSMRARISKSKNKISVPKWQKTGLATDESSELLFKIQKHDDTSPKRSIEPTSGVNDAASELPSFINQGEEKPKDQSGIGAKWSQKSSWRELLGDKSETSFTVKHLLTGAGTTMEEEVEPDDEDTDVPSSADSEDHELDTDSDGPDSAEGEDRDLDTHSDASNSAEGGDHDLDKHPDASNSMDTEDSDFSNQEIVEGQTEEFPEPKRAAEVEMKESNAASSCNLGRGASWLHKSSWTQLVANNQNHLFSLSQICTSANNEGSPEHPDNTLVTGSKQQEPTNASTTGREEAVSASSLLKEPETPAFQDTVGSNPANSHKQEEKQQATTDWASPIIGEECLFMRCSASLRDWANSKAALTRSRKRKKP